MANEELKIKNMEVVLSTAYKLFLQNGIEKVTKEMISRESGLSRRSIDRYFASKMDCIIGTAKWFSSNMQQDILKIFPEEVFTSGEYSGADLLRRYMIYFKGIFLKEHRHFVVYDEFKIYVYRNGEMCSGEDNIIDRWLGAHTIRRKIYTLGMKDGSFSPNIESYTEERYFCESFFGFLSNLAVSFESHSRDKIEKQVDQRIERTIQIYTTKN